MHVYRYVGIQVLKSSGKGADNVRKVYFNHLSQAVMEKKIFKYVSFLNPRPLSQSHFGPQSHHLCKLVRGLLGNATE